MELCRFRRQRALRILSLASFLLFLPLSHCRAESVTVGFVAVVDVIEDIFCQCISEDEVAIGDTLIGYYAYETGAVDTNADRHRGLYRYTAPPNGIHVYHRNYTFASDPDHVNFGISIYDSVDVGPILDKYEVFSSGNLPDPIYAGTLFLIDVYLSDTSATAFSSDALPTGIPDLVRFSNARVSVYGDSGDWGILGEIISVTAGPATAWARRLWRDRTSSLPRTRSRTKRPSDTRCRTAAGRRCMCLTWPGER